MIQQDELRIGNIFNPINRTTEVHLPHSGVFLKVLEIKYFGVSAVLQNVNPSQVEQWTEYKFADMSPIPITKEILIKCGFEQNHLIQREFHKKGDFNFKAVDHYENGFLVICNFMVAGIKLKYLHQLQNIYRLLSGHELKFK